MSLYMLTRLPGPSLETALFMSAVVQGTHTFLVTGGFKMSLEEASGIGERTDGVLKFERRHQWTEEANLTRLERARGGHVAVTMMFEAHFDIEGKMRL